MVHPRSQGVNMKIFVLLTLTLKGYSQSGRRLRDEPDIFYKKNQPESILTQNFQQIFT